MNDVGQTVLLPPLLKFLKQQAPGASARVVSIPLENPGASLSSGVVDFAVGFFDNLATGCFQSLIFHESYVCIVRANHPSFRIGMTLDGFKNTEHAVADATGMAHAVIDRFLARHRVKRNVSLRVPGLHVLPMIVANSDLLAVVPKRLADAFATRVPIKAMPLPLSIPPFDVCIHWHERYHQDPAIRWMRRAFVKLFQLNDGKPMSAESQKVRFGSFATDRSSASAQAMSAPSPIATVPSLRWSAAREIGPRTIRGRSIAGRLPFGWRS